MSFGGGLPPSGPGGVYSYQGEQWSGDPRVSPGLARPVGWRVREPDGTAAYDKFGIGDTQWVPVGAGAGGGVESVTGSAPGIVDNTDPANPIVEAQFGSDVTVDKPNAGSVDVPILRLVGDFVSDVVDHEFSQWAFSLLKDGVQTLSYIFGTDGLTVPDGNTTTPAVNFGDGSGFYKQAVGDLRLIDRTSGVASWSRDIGILMLLGGIKWTVGQLVTAGGPNTANLICQAATTGNVEIGPAGALDPAATAGFLNVPNMPLPPTGVAANVSAGKSPLTIVNSLEGPGIFVDLDGLGTWAFVALTVV